MKTQNQHPGWVVFGIIKDTFREDSLYKFSIAESNLLQLSLGIAANGCLVQASWKAVSLETPNEYCLRYSCVVINTGNVAERMYVCKGLSLHYLNLYIVVNSLFRTITTELEKQTAY